MSEEEASSVEQRQVDVDIMYCDYLIRVTEDRVFHLTTEKGPSDPEVCRLNTELAVLKVKRVALMELLWDTLGYPVLDSH